MFKINNNITINYQTSCKIWQNKDQKVCKKQKIIIFSKINQKNKITFQNNWINNKIKFKNTIKMIK